jgi:protein arginine N-methyltransferase 3
LDFLGTIKLVNYIRSEVRAGNTKLSPLKTSFEDEKYLKPVLVDDSLLYSLDDLDDETTGMVGSGSEVSSMARRLGELEDLLARMQIQFAAYKEEVEKTMATQLNDESPDLPLASSKFYATENSESGGHSQEDEESYFKSYSFNRMLRRPSPSLMLMLVDRYTRIHAQR